MVEDDSALKAPLDLPEDTTPHAPAPPSYNQKQPSGVGKKIFIVLVILIVIGAGGFGAFMLLKPKNKQTSTTTEQKTATATTQEEAVTTSTKTYTNDIMRINFKYPDNWTVTEDSNVVLVTSPEFSYKTVDKGSVNGIFKIYIRQGAQSADSKIIGRGVAVAPSEKLTYANPAPSQRKDTFLTNFGLDTTDNFAYFLIAGNFDLKKGDTLGPNYGKEPDTFIITGGYATKDMKEGLATSTVPVDSYQNTTAYKQAVDVLKSLQIQ